MSEAERICVSFSGGRTSGYMLRWIQTTFPEADLKVIFANTGQEDERTLQFVKAVSENWGIPIIWLETVIHPNERKGATFRLTDFEHAVRDESLFEAMILKYGIPNKAYPRCSDKLKAEPITSYLRSIGWTPHTYRHAIGIRADEMDRQSEKAKEKDIWYPLLKLGTRKADVFSWWSKQPFDLDVPEHRGNCVWCWKKSLRKHLTLMKESPEVFDAPERLERFSTVRKDREPQQFFREKRTVADLRALAEKPFSAFTEKELQMTFGCIESCEPF